jgi:hypothetical protein
MADRSVVVRLKVQDEFSQPVNSYVQKMNAADQATQRAAQGANRAGQGFAQMGTALKGAIVGVGIMGVASLAEGLYSAGMNAQRAGMLFASFGGQVGNTSALLERLRQTTRGVVDDTTLMSAASSQLSMGLARNADDVARLTNIGVTFASAMGQDVQSSMENLNMLLSNQSYLRLDTLGISSAQVRELAAGYRAAGMDSGEAFTAAFMDVAEAKLPQMDAVADSMVGPLQQMQTSLDNWWTDFGTRFAQGVNGLIGMVTHLGEVAGFVMAGLPGGGTSDIPLIDNGPSVGAVNGAMYRQFVQMQGRAGNSALFTPYQQSAYDLTGYSRALAPNYLDLLGGRGSAAAEFEALLRNAPSTRFAGMDDSSVAGGPAFGGLMSRLLNRDYGQIGSFQGGVAYSDEGIANLQAAADRMREVADSAAEVKDMYSSFELDSLKSAADYLEHMASDAENVRDALANATLPEAFGQWGGGRRQEMYNGVLEAMQANGASQDQIDAMSQQFGMDSGAITGMSAQWEQTVAPALADMGEQLGAQAVITWLDSYYAAQEDAMLREYTGPLALDLISQQAGIVPLSGSFGGGGTPYTVRAGDTAWGIAQAHGMTVDQLGLANPRMITPGQQINIGGAGGMQWGYDSSMIGNAGDVGAETDRQAQVAADSYQYHLEGAFTSAVDTFVSLLNNAAAHVVQVPIEFVIQNGGFLNTLLAGAVATVVAGNGGTTPGSSGNTGRSATGSGTRGTNSSSGYSARGGYNPP